MSELASQINARKARLQRFAEAATKFQDKTRSLADIRQAEVLEIELAEKPRRRQYETDKTYPIHTPITWRILRAVSEEFNMPVSEMLSSNQEAEYTLPRYVVIGLLLDLTNMSLPAIGKRIGGRDHTTVLNGRNRLNELLKGESFRNRFEQLKAGIGA